MTTSPGAVGAFRRKALLQVGGVSEDTLAEDTDLTMAVCAAGWEIVYEERALAWTEAPNTAAAFIKQRKRWSFGTLQMMAKHRDVFFRPKYGTLGFVAFPSAILYLLLSIIAPAIDLGALITVTAQVFDNDGAIFVTRNASLPSSTSAPTSGGSPGLSTSV